MDEIKNRLYEDNIIFLDSHTHSIDQLSNSIGANCVIVEAMVTVQMIRSFELEDLDDVTSQVDEQFTLIYKDHTIGYDINDIPSFNRNGMIRIFSEGNKTSNSVTYQKQIKYIVITLMNDEQYYTYIDNILNMKCILFDRNRIDKLAEFLDVNGILLRDVTEDDIQAFIEMHL